MGRIKLQLHNLNVAGVTAAHLFIAGVFGLAVAVAAFHIGNALHP